MLNKQQPTWHLRSPPMHHIQEWTHVLLPYLSPISASPLCSLFSVSTQVAQIINPRISLILLSHLINDQVRQSGFSNTTLHHCCRWQILLKQHLASLLATNLTPIQSTYSPHSPWSNPSWRDPSKNTNLIWHSSLKPISNGSSSSNLS